MGGRVLLVHGVLPAQDPLVPIPAHASAGSTVSPRGPRGRGGGISGNLGDRDARRIRGIALSEEMRNQTENQARIGMKRRNLASRGKCWIKGVAYRSSGHSLTWLTGDFSPQPRHETKPRRLHPETRASTGTAGRAQGDLGACAGTGGRWVWPRRGQVWPCSPATLPAQNVAPHGIDVVRAGLSPAAGSTSGGTGRAGVTPARWLGTRGTTPKRCTLGIFARSFSFTRTAVGPAACTLPVLTDVF